MNSSVNHKYIPDDQRGVMIEAASNAIVYAKEIKECPVEIEKDLMAIHRYSIDGQDSNQTTAPDIYLTNSSYKCEVIVTNVSPYTKQFNLLFQIPVGSMPMLKTKSTSSIACKQGPFTTEKYQFWFYFPNVGEFKHFPCNLSIDQKVRARGPLNSLKVLKTRKIDLDKIESFDDLLAAGTKEDVFNYLKTKNLFNKKQGFKMSKILYLLKDEKSFETVLEILRNRCIFNEKVWSYAFKHTNNHQAMKEYLNVNNDNNLVENLGNYFRSDLIDVDQGYT
mmetsp:Transcript_17445/g.12460  ORF Transcript_17445/g.12460 Transcript_17445/m.12460 type:complete len:278 (+) Transcript_17445:524-1357(+)